MPTPLGSGQAAYGAGVGPAGHDPEDEPSAVAVQEPVSALYFDPFNRTYLQNDDLSMVAGSGPIQRAALLLMPRRALPAVGRSGLDVASIKRALPSQRARIIESELRVAWKALLETAQIAIGKVVLDESKPWNGKYTVDVVDLTAPKQDPVTLKGGV